MAVKQVAIRLKPEGGAEVVREAKAAEDALVKAQTSGTAATERAIAAAERQVQQLREVSTAAALAAQPSAVQQRINQLTGVTGGGNARADVAARTLFAANDDAERRARAIRAEIDPLGAAVDRLNDELRELDQLQRRGALSAAEAARAQALARTRYDETTAALNRQTGGLTRNQVASRLNLTRQAADVVVTAGMGMNPAMIALQQGPQILDALATSGIRAQGAVLLLGGALAASAAAAGVAVAAYLSAENAALEMERAATGLGRASGVTASELEALALTSARLGDVSEASARRQAAAYVSTGRIGATEIARLIEIGKDYAATMGLDAEAATTSLARAMTQPDVAARDLTRSIGLLDQKTLDHIDNLVKLGRQQEAQVILLDALSDAVDGQADRIGGIESAWDAAARAVSNYWDQLGRALYTTPQERLERIETQLRAGNVGVAGGRTGLGASSSDRERLEREATQLRFQIGYDRAEAENRARQAQINRDAQDDRDRRDRANRTRRGGGDTGAADRAAREALQRSRREEDRAAQIEMEVARAENDVTTIRRLEDEAALRDRIRRLVDDGATAADARTRAEEEQNRLIAARGDQFERERETLARTSQLEAARILGNERDIRQQERGEQLARLTQSYREAGLNSTSQLLGLGLDIAVADQAALAARRDMLAIDQARLAVQGRIYEQAQRDREMELARASGDRDAVRRLERDAWIERRAREIERTGREGPMNFGEGTAQAAREWGDLLRAESIGATRDWARGFVQDIRQSGIREALSNQFERAADRLIDRLIDGLFSIDLGGGGGGSNWLSRGLDFLFSRVGKNANGTDFWTGGPTWVGERGPELIWAPRGAAIADADRSKRIAAAGTARGGGITVHATYAPNISVQGSGPEIDALRRELAADRLAFRSNVVAAVNDGIQRREIA